MSLTAEHLLTLKQSEGFAAALETVNIDHPFVTKAEVVLLPGVSFNRVC